MGGPCPPPFRSEPTQIAAVCARRCSAEVYADIKRSKLQLARDSSVVAAMSYIVPRILIRKDGGGFVNAGREHKR